MIVKYSVHSHQKEIIVEGSGSVANVPGNATHITVKFENNYAISSNMVRRQEI